MMSSSVSCGLDAIRSLDGYTADHWTFLTSMCISNRLVLALSIPSALLSLCVALSMLFLLARDYKLTGPTMTMSKIFFICSAITSTGLMLGAMGFLASGSGMVILSTCTFLVGSQGLIGGAYSTLFQWITVTTKMLDLQDEEWLTLRVHALRRTLLVPTYIVFSICMPVCAIRAASNNHTTMYNVVSFLYFGLMMPWFVNWCACASQFSVHFARLIEATVDGTKEFHFSIQRSAGGAKAITHMATPTIGTVTFNPSGLSNPAKDRAAEMLAVAKRVRLVGALIAGDKVLFILLYVVIMIHGLLAWQRPDLSTVPFGLYAVMVCGIPGANFLVCAMAYYHVSTGPSRSS
ncbi:uncharacterized protein EV422DRAFT_508437 [Fimicolochytrium jonesii]|uniref:uncharacterized protein n=1 Tax=Fimicolochytrium jonesii TaxID=1396493 RepID=UPI0022FF274D|nr:uncharacterized protein EV422DRAFT_508437 [Fimicolochytrium jonesii]KAI8818241.1 hypothetical protein EV422DRAFT_508437 [Fimicolochytrium jonesii]